MSVVAISNFEIVRGDDYTFTTRWKVNGTYQSFGSATEVKMTLRQGDTLVAQYTMTGGDITLDTETVADDTLVILMDNATTVDFTPGSAYRYDIQVTDGGQIRTHLMGKVKVIKDVTTP